LTIKNAVDQFTPFVQKVLLDNRSDTQTAIRNYFDSKGVLGSIGGIFTNSFFWTFILTTLLPFVLKAVIFVVIALFAPYLTALEPFLDGLIDLIDQSLLSLDQKANAKAFIALLRLDPATLPVNVRIAPAELHELLLMRDDLENYARPNAGSLFTKGS
jgi:hypothetical protein